MRRRSTRGHPGLVLALIVFALLVAPAAAFDLTASAGSTDLDCCCAPEVAPPSNCCESAEVASEVLASGMDCGCEAPSRPQPGQPAPAPHAPASELSVELHQRMHISAWTPVVFATFADASALRAELAPAEVLTEDRSILHRRRLRGTSVVLALLCVARI